MNEASGAEHRGAAASDLHVDCEVLTRAMAEFLEMPGLHLTERQAARLWGCCSHSISEAVLTHLARQPLLIRTRNGR